MSFHALITNSLVPLRAEADDRSEMESQLLFGDLVKILDEKRQWRFVENHFDGYKGWIDEKAFIPVNESFVANYRKETPVYVRDEVSELVLPGGSIQKLVKGSRLPLYEDGKITIEGKKMIFLGESVRGKQDVSKMLEWAFEYLNAPYLWGGMSPFGIDCSGFTQVLFRTAGLYNLPRNASQQAAEGKLIDFNKRKPGDLAFFANERGKIVHVGIVADDDKILHAHGKVRLDILQVDGIWNEERNEFTHDLVMIKRLTEKD